MIEGITILNQTEIIDFPAWASITISMLIVIAVLCVLFACAEKSLGLAVSSLIAMVGVIVVVLIGGLNPVETGRYEYEVTIDESVNFIDIYENYDVIEQRGDIWVIEDKEMSE